MFGSQGISQVQEGLTMQSTTKVETCARHSRSIDCVSVSYSHHGWSATNVSMFQSSKKCRCSLVASRGIAWFMTSVKHESRQCWVPQRWCTAPAWWALSPKNGSHCSSDPNGCSWCQVHLWWIRMCLQRQDSLSEWPLEVSDALSAWHATKQALLCQHYNKYVYNVYTYTYIYANICIMFYILWTNTLHFNKPKLLQVSGSTACMGAGPCACGTGAGNWSARCSWTTPGSAV